MKFIAIDFETANERRASPCAMGLAWVEDGRVTRREYRLIRPQEMRFGYWETKIHGITAKDVEDEPEFPDVIAEFLPDMDGQKLIAHNAGFDIAVLRATCAAYNMPVPQLSYFCSLQIAKRIWPDDRSHKLNVLAQRLGLSFQHHQASEDALVCAEVVLAAAREIGAASVDALLRELSLQLTSVEAGAELKRQTLRKRAVREAASRGLGFTVRGSRGDLYNIQEVKLANGFDLSCGCMGWQVRKRCRHVQEILEGVVDNLVSESTDGFVQLQQKIARHGIPQQYRCD